MKNTLILLATTALLGAATLAAPAQPVGAERLPTPTENAQLDIAVGIAQNAIDSMPSGWLKEAAQKGLGNFKKARAGKVQIPLLPKPRVYINPAANAPGMYTNRENCPVGPIPVPAPSPALPVKSIWTKSNYCGWEYISINKATLDDWSGYQVASAIPPEGLRADQELIDNGLDPKGTLKKFHKLRKQGFEIAKALVDSMLDDPNIAQPNKIALTAWKARLCEKIAEMEREIAKLCM